MLAVVPERRGEGLGYLLVETATNKARGRGRAAPVPGHRRRPGLLRREARLRGHRPQGRRRRHPDHRRIPDGRATRPPPGCARRCDPRRAAFVPSARRRRSAASRPDGARSVAILAGGRAERLGGSGEGSPRGRRANNHRPASSAVLRGLFERIFLVTNDPATWSGVGSVAQAGVLLVPDRLPGAGPLAGIDAALAALPGRRRAARLRGRRHALSGCGRSHRAARPPRVPPTRSSPGSPATPSRSSPATAAPACPPSPTRSPASASRPAALLDHVAVDYLDEPALRALDPDLLFLTNINAPAGPGPRQRAAAARFERLATSRRADPAFSRRQFVEHVSCRREARPLRRPLPRRAERRPPW